MSTTESRLKVGIVIPNYNYGKWLEKSILSAVNDPYPEKQIAIVDAGSTDDSLAIISQLMGKKVITNNVIAGEIEGVPTVAYCHKKQTGPSKARNTAIKMLWPHVDAFAMLDSDDEFIPGKLEKSATKMMQDPDHIAGVYSDYFTYDEASGLRRVEYKEPFSRERLVRECIIHSACFVSKKALEAVGLYDEQMRTCEDYDLWMRISERFCFVHIPEPLMLVRVGQHSSTSTVKNEIWQQNWKRVMEKAQARMLANGR